MSGEWGPPAYEKRDITPWKGEAYIGSCPCKKAHLLDSKKEALSVYNQDIWGTRCAIKDLFAYMENVISVQALSLSLKQDEINQLFRDARTGPAVDLLRKIVPYMKGREEHLPSCPAIDIIRAMRGGNISCKCKLEEYTKVVQSVDKFLDEAKLDGW